MNVGNHNAWLKRFRVLDPKLDVLCILEILNTSNFFQLCEHLFEYISTQFPLPSSLQ
jgi:hypothetical protein